MAKIKLENDKVIIYYSEVGSGLFDIVKNYKINLTDKKHYFIKSNDNELIDWGMSKDEEMKLVENLQKEIQFQIENCYKVIFSYKQENNIKQVEKHEKHLLNSKFILNFLQNYNLI